MTHGYNGLELSYEEAFEEVVSDSMQAMLTDGNVVQMMADLKQQDRTLWQKICQWFKNLVADMKAVTEAYKDHWPDSAEGRMVADMQETIVILESLYVDALVEASGNYQAAGEQKNTTREGDVRFMSRDDSVQIKEQIVAVSDHLNKMDVVASVTTDGFGGMQKSDIAKAVEKEYAKFGKRVDRQNFGIILLEFPQINKALEYLYINGEKAALLTVPRVLKRGIIADMHTEHKERGVDSITFAAPVEINGKRGNVGVVVQRVAGTNRFKTLRILLTNGKAFEFVKIQKQILPPAAVLNTMV